MMTTIGSVNSIYKLLTFSLGISLFNCRKSALFAHWFFDLVPATFPNVNWRKMRVWETSLGRAFILSLPNGIRV